MADLTLILLPGMDGTRDLFRPLLDVVPPESARRCRVVGYPVDRALTYHELLDVVERRIADAGDLVLVAESFSGPLALRLAARRPERVRAVVLVASFVRAPAPRWLRFLVAPIFFRLPPRAALVRWLLVGRDAPAGLARDVQAAIRRVRPEVMARRLKDVLCVDCADHLRRYQGPLLYLAATDDALVRPRSVQAIRSVRPDVEVRSIPGPHLLLQARPREAWREIGRFLEGVQAGRR